MAGKKKILFVATLLLPVFSLFSLDYLRFRMEGEEYVFTNVKAGFDEGKKDISLLLIGAKRSSPRKTQVLIQISFPLGEEKKEQF